MNIHKIAATEYVEEALAKDEGFFPEYKAELIVLIAEELKSGEELNELVLYGHQYELVERDEELFSKQLEESGLSLGEEYSDRTGSNRAVVVQCMSGKSMKVALFDATMIYSHKSSDSINDIAKYLIENNIRQTASEPVFEKWSENPKFLENTARFSDSSKKKMGFNI